jgi:hypothetical protein
MTAVAARPARRLGLALKVAGLSVLLGPLICASLVVGFAFVSDFLSQAVGAPGSMFGKNVGGMLSIVWGSYLFGTAPAIGCGGFLGVYLYRGGRHLWLVGLSLGLLVPPLLLGVVVVLLFSANYDVWTNVAVMGLVAAVLGLVSAAITGLAIRLILWRSFGAGQDSLRPVADK